VKNKTVDSPYSKNCSWSNLLFT